MQTRDLVFAALADQSDRQELDAQTVLHEDTALEASDLLLYLEDALSALDSGENIWKRVTLFAALSDRSMSVEPEGGLLALLIDTRSAEEGSPEAEQRVRKALRAVGEDLREEIYQEGKDAAVWGWDASIEYITGIWGPRAAAILSEATGAQNSTTRRWIRGGAANNLNIRRVTMLAGLLYDLENKLDWNLEEIRCWMETRLPGSLSPLKLWKKSRYYRLAPEVEKAVQKLGIIS